MDEFISQLMNKEKSLTEEANDRIRIIPTPGCCVKLRDINENKLFVNICTSEKVPEPIEISEAALIKMLENENEASPFTVPLSISEAHTVTDNFGTSCNAYDIVINNNFFTKIETSEVFKAFLMTVILEGLENKFQVSIKKDWIILKNKKCIGTIQEHYIRTKTRPAIVELSSTPNQNLAELKQVKSKSIKPKSIIPPMNIYASPNTQNVEFIIADIKLPELLSSNGVYLNVSRNFLALTTRSCSYEFAAELRWPVDSEATVAEFNCKTKTLHVTMPVA